MNKFVEAFLLTGGIFMQELHLKQPGFTLVLVDHLLNIKKEYENLEKQIL